MELGELSEPRDSVSRRHPSTLYPTERLILDASLSWLAFLPNNVTLWWL